MVSCYVVPTLGGHRLTALRPDHFLAAYRVARFLPVAASDRLYAAWLLAVMGGLRRGELAGLPWSDVDLDRAVLRVTSQHTTDAEWRVVTKEPKGTSRPASTSGRR